MNLLSVSFWGLSHSVSTCIYRIKDRTYHSTGNLPGKWHEIKWNERFAVGVTFVPSVFCQLIQLDEKKMDLHKFALGKYFAIMWKRKGKSEAKMANATFVPYIPPGVDSYENVLFTIFPQMYSSLCYFCDIFQPRANWSFTSVNVEKYNNRYCTFFIVIGIIFFFV